MERGTESLLHLLTLIVFFFLKMLFLFFLFFFFLSVVGGGGRELRKATVRFEFWTETMELRAVTDFLMTDK